MYEYENTAYELGFDPVCGVDEAGRGPLAGPVFAAAVILPRGIELEGVDDSKKLSPKKRAFLFELIQKRAVTYCIAAASEREIDSLNILEASMLAMRRAVEGLSRVPALALVDGNRDPRLGIETRMIIGGDGLSASIAAASILAKVARDGYMERLSALYPQYMFEQHKGYPTKLHYELIAKYGPCEAHRRSFRLA